eukprot:10274268-Lingulodinium_polyedra.AAC.1
MIPRPKIVFQLALFPSHAEVDPRYYYHDASEAAGWRGGIVANAHQFNMHIPCTSPLTRLVGWT